MGKDLTKILAEFDISLTKLQTTITLLNMCLSTAASFYGDYSIAKNEVARNRDLSSYYN